MVKTLWKSKVCLCVVLMRHLASTGVLLGNAGAQRGIQIQILQIILVSGMGRSKAAKLNISDLCRKRQLKSNCGNSVTSETQPFLLVKPFQSVAEACFIEGFKQSHTGCWITGLQVSQSQHERRAGAFPIKMVLLVGMKLLRSGELGRRQCSPVLQRA